MANGEIKPNPDPSVLTNDAIVGAVKAERDYVDGRVDVIETRLDASDEAVKVLSDNVNRVPTSLQEAIANFGALMKEKFKSIDRRLQAAERMRVEQKQDSKTGLDAALAAQKEAATTQDVNNQKAIDKSERATAEIIKNNQESNKQAIETLTKSVDELKLEVGKISASKEGGQEVVQTNRANVAIGVSVILAVAAIITVVILVATKKP